MQLLNINSNNNYFSMQLLKQTIQTVIKNIIHYRQLLNLTGNKYQKHIEDENMGQQISYQIEGISYKIQIDLQEIYSFLQLQEFKQIGQIIKLLFNVLKEERWEKQKQKKFIHQNMPNKNIQTFNQIVCCQCKDLIQKKQISKFKQKIGLTQGITQINQTQITRILKSEVLKELSQNSLQQNSRFHISNLESHLSSLINTIQKSTECKTFNFLYSNQSLLPEQHTIKLQQQKIISNEIQKYLQQIQQNSTQQFVTKLTKKLKVPLRQVIKRLYGHINIVKQQRYRQNHVESSVQTMNQLDQKGKPLTGKYFQLQNQLTNVKFSKLKTQNNVKKLQQIQKQLRTQLEFQKQKSLSLNQKIINFEKDFNAMENKYIYECNNKKIQILRLQRIIKQLEQKKQQVCVSKKSTKSIKGNNQNKISCKKIERRAQKDFQRRPSVEFNLFQDRQASNMKIISKYLPSSNKKVVTFTRRGSKNSNFVPKLQISQQTPRKQNPISFIYSQHNIQDQQIQNKINQFQIISQINFFYIPVKKQQSKNNIQQKDKKQSIKYKLYKRYQNQLLKTQNYQSKTLIFSERKSFSNKKIANKHYEQKLFQKKYNKMQSHQILQQIQNIPKSTSRVQRIGTALFKNKTRFVKQKSIQKKIINQKLLPQLKKSDICLFGDEKTALQYEKQIGQWPKYATDGKLVIDLQNQKFIGEIIKYFRYLHLNCPEKYKQYLQFLLFPVSLWQMKKNKKAINQIHKLLLNNSTELQKDDKQKVFQAIKIKQIFIKIIRFHRIHHKNCRHVQQFLRMIKFYQF